MMPTTPFEWVVCALVILQVGSWVVDKLRGLRHPRSNPVADTKPIPGSQWVQGDTFRFINERGDRVIVVSGESERIQ